MSAAMTTETQLREEDYRIAKGRREYTRNEAIFALATRVRWWTYADIGEAFGLSASYVGVIVRRLKRIHPHSPQRWRC